MKILLVQTSFLGDVILSTPLIAALKKLYPDSELHMLTTPQARELVARDPLLKDVLVYDKRGMDRGLGGIRRQAHALKRRGFDRAYALQRSMRTALVLRMAAIPHRVGFSKAVLSFLYHERLARDRLAHEALRNLGLLAREAAPGSFDCALRLFAPDAADVQAQVRDLPSGAPYAVLVPGSAWRTKMWHWEHYRKVALHYLELGWNVVVAGAAAESEVCGRVSAGTAARNMCGALSISEFMFVVKHAGLMVCNDSMALHMASAFNICNIAVFCSTSPQFGFGPWLNPRARVVEHSGLECKPCGRHGFNSCPTGTQSCMREPAADLVIAASQEMLAAQR